MREINRRICTGLQISSGDKDVRWESWISFDLLVIRLSLSYM